MPQLGRLSSKSLAGLFPATGRKITWTRYSLAVPTTGLQLLSRDAVSDGNVAFFMVSVNQLAATNRIFKFNGSALVEQVLPTPSVNCTPRFGIYANGKFIIFGKLYPEGAYGQYRCVWVSTDGGNTFSVTNYATELLAGNGISSVAFSNNTYYIFGTALSGSPRPIYYQSSSNGTTWSSLVSGGTSANDFALSENASSGTRVLLKGIYTGGETCYQRLLTATSTFNSVTISPPITSNSLQIAWLRGFGFVLVTGESAASVYSMTETNLDAGSNFSIWGAPGTNFSSVAVADNGVNSPVIAFKDYGFGVGSGKISFDGGSTFSSFSIPSSTTYSGRLSGYGNRFFIPHFSSGATEQDITVGVIS
jgi:hypothetical protein